jgi:hypothetical protein
MMFRSPSRTTVTMVLASVALLATVGSPAPSFGDPIFMPAGSNVWMKWESNACPFADGNDCAGSNQPGLNPPNGIPLTTIVNAGSFTTGFAEILPDRVRTFIAGNSATFMSASFNDTYTVQGTAVGPFDITVDLHVTGVGRQSTPGFVVGVVAEIGTFSPVGDAGGGVALPEQFRVTPFPGSTTGNFFASNPVGDQIIDTTASFTLTDVEVGDVFTLAYGVTSSVNRGELDLRNTGVPSFDLPDGVFLTSALGGRFGAQTVPEPPAVLLIGAGLTALGGVGAIRRRRGGARR